MSGKQQIGAGRTIGLAAVVLAAVAVCPRHAGAANRWWMAWPSANWSAPGSWWPAEPNPLDQAWMWNGGTAQITAPNNETCSSLWQSWGSVNMTGGTLNSNWEDLRTFSQSAGTHTTGTLNLGRRNWWWWWWWWWGWGGSSSYNLSGTGTLNANSEYIGSWGGLSSVTQTGGTNTANSRLYVGNRWPSIGIYDQRGGSVTTNTLGVGVNNRGWWGWWWWGGPVDWPWYGGPWWPGAWWWGRGDYYLGVGAGTPNPTLQANVENIGWGGRGYFRQDRGTNTCNDLYVGRGRWWWSWWGPWWGWWWPWLSQGTYDLNGGSLNVSGTEYIGWGGWGNFRQTGGVNTTGKLRIRWGWYTMTGGRLRVTNPFCTYVGDRGPGTFEHLGGEVDINGTLHVGSGPGGDGRYILNIDPNNTDPNDPSIVARLVVRDEIIVGDGGGRGRFEWFNGEIKTPQMTVAKGSELAMGFDFHMADLAGGALGPNTVLVNGLLEITNGATATDNPMVAPSLQFSGLRVGSELGGGTYRLMGGTKDCNYVEVNGGGVFQCAGSSTINMGGGGLHVAGDMDLGGHYVTLNVGGDSLVNLTDANVLGAHDTSVWIEPNTLTILRPGFDPYMVFHTYVNYGRTHVAGSPLEIHPHENYVFQGHIPDHVRCYGSVSATAGGSVSMYGGLEVSGNVDLGRGMLIVNDPNSRISPSGQLKARDMRIGTLDHGISGSGVFTQYGGHLELSNELSIAHDANTVGSYKQIDGTCRAGAVYVGREGSGTFDLVGGSFDANGAMYIACEANSHGHAYVNAHLSATHVVVGGNGEQIGGTGHLHVDANGSVQVSGNVRAMGAGTVKIEHGGLLSAYAVELMGGGTLDAEGSLDANVDVTTEGSIVVEGPFGELALYRSLTMTDSVSVSKEGSGTLKVEGSVTWETGTTLTVKSGTVDFNLGASSPVAPIVVVEPNTLLVIESGATVNAGGMVDPFYDPNGVVNEPNDIPAVDILNYSASSFNVTSGCKKVGVISDPNYGGKTTVSAGACLEVTSIDQGILQVDGNLTLREVSPPTVSLVKQLGIGPVGQIDLTRSELDIDYSATGASPIDNVYNWVTAGQINSSIVDPNKAVGYFDDTLADNIRIVLTWKGDIDCDRDVDLDDLTIMGTFYNASGPMRWYHGDVDGDGDVDLDDLTLLGTFYNATPSVPGTPAGAPPIPEPAAISLLGLGAVALLVRRRQR